MASEPLTPASWKTISQRFRDRDALVEFAQSDALEPDPGRARPRRLVERRNAFFGPCCLKHYDQGPTNQTSVASNEDPFTRVEAHADL